MAENEFVAHRSPTSRQLEAGYLRNPLVVIANIGKSLSDAFCVYIGDAVIVGLLNKVHDTN